MRNFIWETVNPERMEDPEFFEDPAFSQAMEVVAKTAFAGATGIAKLNLTFP